MWLSFSHVVTLRLHFSKLPLHSRPLVSRATCARVGACDKREWRACVHIGRMMHLSPELNAAGKPCGCVAAIYDAQIVRSLRNFKRTFGRRVRRGLLG